MNANERVIDRLWSGFTCASRLAFEVSVKVYNKNNALRKWNYWKKSRFVIVRPRIFADTLAVLRYSFCFLSSGKREFDLLTRPGGNGITAEIISLIKINIVHSHKVHFTQSKRMKEIATSVWRHEKLHTKNLSLIELCERGELLEKLCVRALPRRHNNSAQFTLLNLSLRGLI